MTKLSDKGFEPILKEIGLMENLEYLDIQTSTLLFSILITHYNR